MAETRHGERSDTKLTKITKKTQWVFFVIFVVLMAFVAEREPSAVSPRAQQAEQTTQKPPVFRAGAHYVRVDAYPTGKDGKIIEGLTRDDFEVFEDGKPQAIEQADFITFDTWTPDGERKDPRTQQDAYDLAADPTWRVFVIVIDPNAYGLQGRHYMRGPLHEFLDRNLGPRDLFGLLTTESEWTDLVLGQQTTAAKAVIDTRQWINPPDYDERLMPLYECGLGSLVPIKKLDDTYTLLEGLVKLLGLVRQERKSIVLVTNGLSVPGPGRSTNILTPPDLPRIPGPTAPIGGMARPGDRVGTINRSRECAGERMRLTTLNFSDRFRELLRDARRANVAFYPISPAGLQGMPFTERGGIDMRAYHRQNERTDSLITLANETDGVAIVNTNDLAGGMRRIATDVRAYYVLGYYTNNTTWDGKVRSIKVRLKQKKDSIRARRQYRAPTLAEIAELSGGARGPAPPPPRPVSTPGSPVLVGEAIAYRVAPRQPPQKLSTFEFVRTERIRVEWPLLGTLDRREVRMLDRTGKPLPVELPLAEDASGGALVVEVPLSAFARGEYALELSAGSGATSERRVLALTVK